MSLILGVSAWALSGHPAAGGPITFFKRLGHSIAHPRHEEAPRRTVRKKKTKSKPRPEATHSAGESQNVVTTKEAQTAVQPTSASAASASDDSIRQKHDLPYGLPVPNAPGFVFSPYSADGSYVDVTGYPKGTAVKDPYTGNIFLTP